MRTIYFLRNAAGDVLYIGCTAKLKTRLANVRYVHCNTWWPEVADLRYYEVRDDQAAEEERSAIAHFKPLYNKQGVSIAYRSPRPAGAPVGPRRFKTMKPTVRVIGGIHPARLIEGAA